MMVYKCRICGCRFAVEKEFIKKIHGGNTYLTCPADGRHSEINLVGTEDFKKIMEECKGVEL